MNIDDFIKQIAVQFRVSIQQAWWIAESLIQMSQAQLISKKNIDLTDFQKKQLEQWIYDYKILHKPLQYILGEINFCGIEIFVEPPILIPRNETEYWCDWLSRQLSKLSNKKLTILDMCTGSGCIGIFLAKKFPESIVYAVDISEQALELTKKNAKHNNVKNLIIVNSDLFNNLINVTFDLIVSNPPYIDINFYNNLDSSVKNWEDKQALISKDSGLEIIKKIIQQSPKFLKLNQEFIEKNIPQIVIEIDIQQGEIVKKIMNEAGFINIDIHKDLTLRDRFVTANWKK